jgi:hypothetical protein
MSGFYGEKLHIVPVLAPVDAIAVTQTTDVVDCGEVTRLQFLAMFGVITTQDVTITLEACDDIVPTTSPAIVFSYRLSSAVGTDLMGAHTAVTVPATGCVVTTADDGKTVLIDVDPAALTAGYPYARLTLAPTAGCTVSLMSVVALMTPRYAQNVVPSVVD